jgi:ABC-type nickel/cobalt efflux system permease component RcnA
MTAISSPPSAPTAATRGGRRLAVSEMWTSLAIAVIWIVVLVDALFGPDIVSSSAGSFARIPSAVVVAFFAWLATWVIARNASRDRRDDGG